jgi:hypothetical protein
MKKKIMMIAVAALVAGLLVVPVIAKGPSDQAGKSNIGHLYLYEKVESKVEWTEGDCVGKLVPWLILEGGAWGKMKYNLSGPTFDFVFNGHGLPKGVEYTLIYYPDDWTFAQLGNIICLGSGVTNDGGNIHIAGSVDMTESLPIDGDVGDCNYGYDGAKIWLVLSDNFDSDNKKFSAWDAAAYLFEDDVIFFTLTE